MQNPKHYVNTGKKIEAIRAISILRVQTIAKLDEVIFNQKDN